MEDGFCRMGVNLLAVDPRSRTFQHWAAAERELTEAQVDAIVRMDAALYDLSVYCEQS